LNYPEPAPPIWRSVVWRGTRKRRQRRVNKIADSPNAIGNIKRKGRCRSQRFVNAAKIVMTDVKTNGGFMVRQLL
jgi:hypothetical protein